MKANFLAQYILYHSTGKFSQTVIDYLNQNEELRSFYEHTTDIEGIKKAIEQKQKHPINRTLLAAQLHEQYRTKNQADAVQQNIDLLLDENTFTICTAHQPNIFTGHLYFIYKIMHVLRMADDFKKEFPEFNFVPVFFMGSEDADLDELNNIVIDGKTYTWDTNQKGAVGRMVIDKKFIELIHSFEGRLLAEPFGKEIADLARSCYKEGSTIETATFHFVHELFKEFGLVVFLPDNAACKAVMQKVFEDDLLHHTPSKIVQDTSARLSAHHHAQAFARDINLFYMKDDIRNRIVQIGENFVVHETDIHFTKEEILKELEEHPERFSPNVILRGLFQEMILPDIAFVGGGGELAYWLQLKDIFDHYRVPYPVIVLRNSFLIIEHKWKLLLEKLNLTTEELFREKGAVLKDLVISNSNHSLELSKEKESLETLFDEIRTKVQPIDVTLNDHVEALKTRSLKQLIALEKKMLSAEKKKFEATSRQLDKLFSALNGHGLQERTDNFMLFYALWGKDFLKAVYDASMVLEAKFCVLQEGGEK